MSSAAEERYSAVGDKFRNEFFETEIRNSRTDTRGHTATGEVSAILQNFFVGDIFEAPSAKAAPLQDVADNKAHKPDELSGTNGAPKWIEKLLDTTGGSIESCIAANRGATCKG